MTAPNAGLRSRIRTALLAINGVLESPGVFGDDDAFWVNGKQIAHFIDGGMELRLTKSAIREHRTRLKTDERVELRRNASDWLIVRPQAPKDVPLVAELAELAAAAHRAPAGTMSKPPPEGADLARRRRFH